MSERVRAAAMIAVMAVLLSGTAFAIPFTGSPSPSLSPVFGTLINFDDKATGTPVLPTDYLSKGVIVSETESLGIFARYSGSQSMPNYIGTGPTGERGTGIKYDGGSLVDSASTGWDGTIRFTFFNLASRVGIGIADSLPGTGDGPEVLSVFGIGGTLLERFTAPAGLNVYAGFTRSSFDISYFEVSGDFFAVDDLQFNTVPEPGTLLLIGSGLTGLVALSRRRRRL